MFDLLTEKEVADKLRCSTSKVKRLRLDGKLAYLPGRPVMIREGDLNAYIESALCRNPPIEAKEQSARTSKSRAAVKEKGYDPAATARRIWILRRLRAKNGG
ncbi:helix-turn-helix domain-containing protein [Mesorhizobium sp. SP-1A]|uniref:helix-turn-helix domain-containing protein n=1 Tax=Mesorhizobium sp. SP-1A TaxID=3077840 RepID=UPI0028F6C7FB|nr:helix-turn-helix domain-containing protein [Mesorhizobium sp. SP-1A]